MKEQNDFVIVVGGDHYNTLWIIRTLGLKEIYSDVIILSDTKSFVQKSKYIKNSWIVSTKDEVILKLLELKRSRQKGFIISSNDLCAETMDLHYNELSKWYYLSNVNNNQGKLSYWMDKYYMTNAALQAGFNVAKSWVIDLNSIEIPDDLIYPCIIKPRYSSRGAKSDFRICKNIEDLKRELHSTNFTTTDLLVQEHLVVDYDFSVLGVYLENENKNIIPGTLYKTGTCGKIDNLGMPTYAYVDENVSSYISLEAVSKFFKLIPYRGLYSIEFIFVKDKAYFVELNMRVDGDLFVYTIAGINMPYLWIKDLKEELEDTKWNIKGKTIGMTEISYFKHLKTKNPFRIIKDLLQTDCFSIFNLKDLQPFIYKIIYYFI